MKRTLLVLSTFFSALTYAQDCSDLFISEYVEGWSNNKALEIYNPTNSTIDLSQYMVVRYSNGATTATAANAVQLIGSIAPYDVHVGVLEKLDPNGVGQEAPIWDSLQVRADQFYCPDYNISNAWYWNGNDAIILYKGTINDIANAQIIDVFGKVGEDPNDGTVNGWTSTFPYVSSGDVVTEDHSMIRKSTVLKGQTNPLPAYFNPLGEWDSIPAVIDIGGQTYGNWSTLGSHTCDCLVGVEENKMDNVSIYPNPSANGVIYVRGASVVASVEVYDALGQVIATAENGANTVMTIDLSGNKGVYLVKMISVDGSTTTKRVILK